MNMNDLRLRNKSTHARYFIVVYCARISWGWEALVIDPDAITLVRGELTLL